MRDRGRRRGRRRLHARRVRRSVSRGRPPLSRGAAGRHRARRRCFRCGASRPHGSREQMIDGGLRARLACVDTRMLDASFAGREFDRVAAAPTCRRGVDPCGENGEFHTCVYAGPMFDEPLRLETGESSRASRSSWRDLHARAIRATESRELTSSRYPSRIVCLTEETTETLYLLGEGDRVVGVSGYTVRPPEARQQAAGLGVHQRALRQDRGAQARPDPRLLRSAGRHRRRAGQARLSGDARSTSAASPRSCR